MSVSCWISYGADNSRSLTHTGHQETNSPAVKATRLKGELLSVVEEHEDGHLEGRNLQDVLPGVGAGHLCSSYSKL